jgi:hypothetical protein
VGRERRITHGVRTGCIMRPVVIGQQNSSGGKTSLDYAVRSSRAGCSMAAVYSRRAIDEPVREQDMHTRRQRSARGRKSR